MAPEERRSTDPTASGLPVADPAILARTERSALQRLDVARSLATAANRVFLLFFVSLALLWVQRVVPLAGQLADVGQARTKFLSARLASRSQLQQAYQRQVNDVRADPLELPGGFKLTVPAYYSPLVWGFLCTALISYLHFVRRRHFALAGRNLRILREDVGYSHAALADLCPALPWWLAPLPARNGKVIQSEDLYRAAGWVTNQRRIVLLSSLSIGLLILLQFYTLYLSWRTSMLIATQSKTEQFWMLEATAVLGVLTVLVAFDWMRPARVPDNRVAEVNPNQLSRREFAGSSALAILSLVPYPFTNLTRSFFPPSRRKNYASVHAPRFKRKRKSTVPAPAAAVKANAAGLINPRSGVLHYISGQGEDQPCLHGIKAASLDKMRPVDLLQAILAPGPPRKTAPSRDKSGNSQRTGVAVASEERPRTRIHQDYESRIFQQEATKALNANNPVLACTILFKALEHRRRDFRLYDRVASITVQHDLPQQRQRLIQLAEGRLIQMANPGGLHAMAYRAADLSPSGETSGLGDLFHRMIGQDPGRIVTGQSRGRSKCRGGKLFLRKPASTKKITEPEALQRRVRNWKDTNSKWYKKWSSGERQWREPSSGSRCHPA